LQAFIIKRLDVQYASISKLIFRGI